MKTKVKTITQTYKNEQLIAVLRYNNDPIAGDVTKIYVNYVYPYSLHSFSYDECNRELLKRLFNKVLAFANNNGLHLAY